jgi:hypothetical protein
VRRELSFWQDPLPVTDLGEALGKIGGTGFGADKGDQVVRGLERIACQQLEEDLAENVREKIKRALLQLNFHTLWISACRLA